MLTSVLPGRSAPQLLQRWGEALGPGPAFSAGLPYEGGSDLSWRGFSEVTNPAGHPLAARCRQRNRLSVAGPGRDPGDVQGATDPSSSLAVTSRWDIMATSVSAGHQPGYVSSPRSWNRFWRGSGW